MTDDQKAARNITVDDGKYTLILDPSNMRALRHGEPWRDLCGDGFIMALGHKIEDLTAELDALAARVATLTDQSAETFRNAVCWQERATKAEARVAVLEGQGEPEVMRYASHGLYYAHPTPEALARAERAEALVQKAVDHLAEYVRVSGAHNAQKSASLLAELIALFPSPATQLGFVGNGYCGESTADRIARDRAQDRADALQRAPAPATQTTKETDA